MNKKETKLDSISYKFIKSILNAYYSSRSNLLSYFKT